MSTSSSLRRVLAVMLLTPASVFAAAASLAPVEKGLTIIQTSEPAVHRHFNQVLPAMGEVQIVINVDADGRLADWLPIVYSHPNYLQAVAEALKDWRFEPARRNGEPIGSRQSVRFYFESRGQVASLSMVETADVFFRSLRRPEETQCVFPGRELDEVPKPVKTVQPLYVPQMEGLRPGAGVKADFFIDESGKPRMITVDDYENLALAQATVHALEQWEFSVPRKDGRPVMTRATQWFNFTPGAAAPRS